VLFRGEEITPEDRDLARMLDFFAIPSQTVTVHDGYVAERKREYAIVSSADRMASVIEDAKSSGEVLPSWITNATAVYVYGFQNNERSNRLLRFLTGDAQAKVRSIRTPDAIMTITGDAPGMCGPMSGMRVPVTLAAPGCVCEVGTVGETFQSVVRCEAGEVFFGVTRVGVRFYLNAWGRTLDIDALSPAYFDVKEFFCEAVPFVFFLKWAFPDAAWGRAATSACLIVDDPPLKRRYGFLDFHEALDLMERHNFTTTVAFIPWNWRRTDPPVVELFRSNPRRLSLVFHGCDHTGGEFAARCPALLNRMIQTSGERMERFRRRASIEADRVMVFPQGRFSPETGRALKLDGFVAAVNTEVAPDQGAANETTIADLWSVAVMKYGSFPIFTRRYLHHGIENFAFDGLLGKPCLIAAHHDVFRDHARNLVDFVTRLNSLNWNLIWRPLGEAVRRSFTVSCADDGTSHLRMFAGGLIVENPGTEMPTLLLKREADPNSVADVIVNDAPVAFSFTDKYLRVRLTIPPGDKATVRIAYHKGSEGISGPAGSGRAVKVAAKRYLSEFRDNYLARNAFLYRGASRLKQFVK
jgi:hypothetical protein